MLNFSYDIEFENDTYNVELTRNNLIGVAHMSGWRCNRDDGRFTIVPPARIGCIDCGTFDTELEAWENIDFDKVLNDEVAADLAVRFMKAKKFKLSEMGAPPIEREFRYDLQINELSFNGDIMQYTPRTVRFHGNTRIEAIYKAVILAAHIYAMNAQETHKLMQASFGPVGDEPIIL